MEEHRKEKLKEELRKNFSTCRLAWRTSMFIILGGYQARLLTASG